MWGTAHIPLLSIQSSWPLSRLTGCSTLDSSLTFELLGEHVKYPDAVQGAELMPAQSEHMGNFTLKQHIFTLFSSFWVHTVLK